MGCNLCTLQKREEHYKLLYEIAQVNGRAFSKAEHEDAVVEAIRRDPIVVQVLRRAPAAAGAGPHGNPQDVYVADAGTQTDITFEHIAALAKLRPSTPPVPDICPFLLSDSCHSIHTMEHEFYECPEYLSNNSADVERTEEFEYEEVELCRTNSQEKLGLTLCYQTDDEEDTAIYVSQVGRNSIAARDGRIREGDRILQINGCDVQSREEAVALLSSEDTRSVLLLVTRPEQLEEVWLDEEHNEFLEELKMEILGRSKEEHRATGDQSKCREEEEEVTTDAATCSSNTQDKDSGLGSRSTESPDPEPLFSRGHGRGSTQGPRPRWQAEGPRRGPLVPSNLQGGQAQGAKGVNQAQDVEGNLCMGSGGGLGLGLENRFQQLLELKCQIRNGGECGVYSIRHSRLLECSLTEKSGGTERGRGGGGAEGVEQELKMLNEELRSIELECQSIMQAHQLRKSHQRDPSAPTPQSPGQSPNVRHKRQGRLADIHEHTETKSDSEKVPDKDSSSAYNTAESAQSTPHLGMDRGRDQTLQRRISITNQRNLRSTQVSTTRSVPIPIPGTQRSTSCRPRPDPGLLISSSPDQSNPSPSESDPALPADDERCERRGRARGSQRGLPYASPYHTAPHQGPAGAKQLQSYMHLLQQSSTLEYSQSQLSLLSLCREPLHRSARPGEPRLEWKVKVRADGTRYVARRPARDRILRERALRIREERSGGMTTDDDAMSEMKMGRYWSKEERKQHLARAREQRKRREHMMKSRLECLREVGSGSGAEGRKEPISILELSHRKMMKKRNRKILDNWMTIQELMSHGARAAPPEGTKVHNAFLSVTTV